MKAKNRTCKRVAVSLGATAGVGIVIALLAALAFPIGSDRAERTINAKHSCFDSWKYPCGTGSDTMDRIEDATGVIIPASAELLYSRSGQNSLQSAAHSSAVVSIDSSDEIALPEQFTHTATRDFDGSRSAFPAILDHLGFEQAERSYSFDGTTVTFARAKDAGKVLVVIEKQYYT